MEASFWEVCFFFPLFIYLQWNRFCQFLITLLCISWKLITVQKTIFKDPCWMMFELWIQFCFILHPYITQLYRNGWINLNSVICRRRNDLTKWMQSFKSLLLHLGERNAEVKDYDLQFKGDCSKEGELYKTQG